MAFICDRAVAFCAFALFLETRSPTSLAQHFQTFLIRRGYSPTENAYANTLKFIYHSTGTET